MAPPPLPPESVLPLPLHVHRDDLAVALLAAGDPALRLRAVRHLGAGDGRAEARGERDVPSNLPFIPFVAPPATAAFASSVSCSIFSIARSALHRTVAEPYLMRLPGACPGANFGPSPSLPSQRKALAATPTAVSADGASPPVGSAISTSTVVFPLETDCDSVTWEKPEEREVVSVSFRSDSRSDALRKFAVTLPKSSAAGAVAGAGVCRETGTAEAAPAARTTVRARVRVGALLLRITRRFLAFLL